jgi:hypothetical protein
MYLAFRSKAGVMTADPVLQCPILLHACSRFSLPAAAKIAPQTPPPAQRPSFAAFTIASVFSAVMLIFLIEMELMCLCSFLWFY